MNSILVTGATGFIGFEVASQLASAGKKPRLLVRRPMRGTLLGSLEAEIVLGSLEDEESLRRAVKGCQSVIHLGARATFERYDRVRPTIVDGSRKLMQVAQEAGVKHFIYGSSLLVYPSQDAPIDLSTPARPTVDYGQAKLDSEAVLSDLAQETGISLGIIRLPHVYGACDLIFTQIRKGMVLNPGKGDNLYAHMHVQDAARVLIEAAEQGWSGLSPVADERPADWNEFFSLVKAGFPRFRVIHVPRWLALVGTWMLTRIRTFQKRPVLETPDAIRAWTLNLQVARGMLWDDLGLSPRYPTVEQGIPAVLDSSISFRWIHSMDDCCPQEAACAYDRVDGDESTD